LVLGDYRLDGLSADVVKVLNHTRLRLRWGHRSKSGR